MGLIVEFEINDLPKMTNRTAGKHWFNKHSESVKFRRLINEQLTLAKVPPLKLEKAILTLKRYSSKAPDSDGLVSGFKVVIDAIVRYGVLEDDSYKHIGMPNYSWEYRTRKLGGKISVRIET